MWDSVTKIASNCYCTFSRKALKCIDSQVFWRNLLWREIGMTWSVAENNDWVWKTFQSAAYSWADCLLIAWDQLSHTVFQNGMSRRQRLLIPGDEPRTASQERCSKATVLLWNCCVIVGIAHQWHQTIRRVWHHLCNVGHQTGMKVLSPGVKQKKRQEREKNRCRALSRIRTWKINRRKKVGSENQLATFFWKLLRKKKTFCEMFFNRKLRREMKR